MTGDNVKIDCRETQNTGRINNIPGPAHTDMPSEFVKFVTTLWNHQYAEGCRSFSRGMIEDRKIYFDRILSNVDLARLATRGYETLPGQKVLQAMVAEAVCIPECWQLDDKRSWSDRETYLRLFGNILTDLGKFLNIETSGAPSTRGTHGEYVPVWTEFEPGASARAARTHLGSSTLLEELSKRADGFETGQVDRVRAFRQVARPSPDSAPTTWRAQPMRGNLLVDLRSNVISSSQWDKVDNLGVLVKSSPGRYVLSIYDLQKIIRAFRKPLEKHLNSSRRKHDSGVMEGHAVLRYTARTLDKMLNRFTKDFQSKPKTINFSRYGAISCFIGALYGEHYSRGEVFEPRRVHAWCRSRRA